MKSPLLFHLLYRAIAPGAMALFLTCPLNLQAGVEKNTFSQVCHQALGAFSGWIKRAPLSERTYSGYLHHKLEQEYGAHPEALSLRDQVSVEHVLGWIDSQLPDEDLRFSTFLEQLALLGVEVRIAEPLLAPSYKPAPLKHQPSLEKDIYRTLRLDIPSFKPLKRTWHLLLMPPAQGSHRSPEALYRTALGYAKAIMALKLAILERKFHPLALPWGHQSFFRLFQHELAQVHGLYYNLLLLAQKQGIELEGELPLTDHRSRWLNRSRFAMGVVFQFFFPFFYQATSLTVPNQQQYALFVEGRTHADGLAPQEEQNPLLPLQDSFVPSYRLRVQLKYLIQRYRLFLLGSALMLAVGQVDDVVYFFTQGGYREIQTRVKELREDFGDAQKVNASIEEYEQQPEPFYLVKRHYDQLIEKERAEALEDGDPLGKHQKQIQYYLLQTERLGH